MATEHSPYGTGKTNEAIYAFAEPLTPEAFQRMMDEYMHYPYKKAWMKKRKTYQEVKAKQRRRKKGLPKP